MDYSGNWFTLTNNRHPGAIEERLDCVLINRAWNEVWPVSSVSHVPRYKSDHCPILLHCENRKRWEEKKREWMFRFEELWLQ